MGMRGKPIIRKLTQLRKIYIKFAVDNIPNRDISDLFDIDILSVRELYHTIYKFVGVHSKVELVEWAKNNDNWKPF